MADKNASLTSVGGGGGFSAPLNPGSYEVSVSVPWAKHIGNQTDAADLEFTNREPEVLSIEFLFDCYEQGDLAADYLDPLKTMTMRDPSVGRPPMVLFVWGSFKFQGVIESLSLKYTMFSDVGNPVRATASIKLKEAESVSSKSKQGGAPGGGPGAKEAGRAGVPEGQEHNLPFNT